MKKIAFAFLLVAGISISCEESKKPQTTGARTEVTIENPTNFVGLSSEINWGKLNPARGENSPVAGNVWGDRTKDVATGFLVKFKEGFSSPPHIHNVTYRAIVVKGAVHNDDPAAENMWMGPHSFWTQPKGLSHITSASEEENIAYVEIDAGPYLVRPTGQAFTSDEVPINIDSSNLIWLNSTESRWLPANSKVKISFLWEKNDSLRMRGLYLKMPEGFEGKLVSDGNIFQSIIISGALNYTMPEDDQAKILDVGSHFGATSKAVHDIKNTGLGEALIYVRTNGSIQLTN